MRVRLRNARPCEHIIWQSNFEFMSPGGKNGKEGSQGSDAPKEDYIHMRARRGQATNSHSLAERVRREKISERMKFLQDLVPGCSKVTGKAVMLDEIINYVQSLQRQVEVLCSQITVPLILSGSAAVDKLIVHVVDQLMEPECRRALNRTVPSSGFGDIL